jgi:hypothetical protein
MQRRPPPCCSWVCGRGRERGTSCCWSASQHSTQSVKICSRAHAASSPALRQDLLELPACDAREFLASLFRCRDLLKVSAQERRRARALLHSVCTHQHCPTRAPPHRPSVAQVGYGLAGDLGALAAALGGVCAVEPAIDLASLHRTLAVKGLASLPLVRRGARPISAARHAVPLRSSHRRTAPALLARRSARCRNPRSDPAPQGLPSSARWLTAAAPGPRARRRASAAWRAWCTRSWARRWTSGCNAARGRRAR